MVISSYSSCKTISLLEKEVSDLNSNKNDKQSQIDLLEQKVAQTIADAEKTCEEIAEAAAAEIEDREVLNSKYGGGGGNKNK